MTWVSYAQNYEDVVLMRALAHVGRGVYVDVGANDPRVDSVTRAFYERGWRGVNIEPVGHWFERLAADRPEDRNLQVAAGAREGRMRLFEIEGTGLSTADPALARRHAAAGRAVREREVPVSRLDRICADAGLREVHFLKIDVEGAEREVLAGCDFSRLRPWVVVVESTEPGTSVEAHADWEPMLTGQGYAFAWFDGLNRFYVSQERAFLAPALAVPPNVLDDFMRYVERLLRDEVDALKRACDEARRAHDDAQSSLVHAIAAEHARGDALQAELDRTRASRSWRITAPLRVLGDWLRRARMTASRGGAAAAVPSVGSATGAASGLAFDAHRVSGQGDAREIPVDAGPPLDESAMRALTVLDEAFSDCAQGAATPRDSA